MRKLFTILLGTAALLHAQVGVARNAHGMRVPSAHTLEQGFIYFSGNLVNVSDGEPLALDGYTDLSTGETFDTEKGAAAASGAAQVSYGVFDFLELGISLPFYYESKVMDSRLAGLALGDIQTSVKANIPIKDMPLHLSLEGDLYIPSGARGRGFRPRHSWFI